MTCLSLSKPFGLMKEIRFYEIDEDYVDYLSEFASHLFHNKHDNGRNSRKYIGILFKVNNYSYFAPLSSFKQKHIKMKESLDFIKVKNYSVINLNNMFPVPDGVYTYVDFKKVTDSNYRRLLESEYRYIKSIQEKIIKNAKNLYNHKLLYRNDTSLAKRCNDFVLLEEKCHEYQNNHTLF